WTLTHIQWWGGWADGEHYLLNNLHSYEEDHADVLCPIPKNASQSHARAAALAQSLCCDEAHHMLGMPAVETKSHSRDHTGCTLSSERAVASKSP
ncbi:hypothetical protein FIBSPDRAFT_770813, partial [Athelia psychrophila]